MIKETVEVKPDLDAKLNAYPCIFMSPPTAERDQSCVVYGNRHHTAKGVWKQIDTQKSLQITHTDTFGNGFKNMTGTPNMQSEPNKHRDVK